MSNPSPRFFENFTPLTANKTQADRRAQLIHIASHMAHQCFSPQGNWKLPSVSADARERIWLCFALMLNGPVDIALANAILAQTCYKQNTPSPGPADAVHPFDIFVSNHCVQMLVLHADKLQPEVLKKIQSWARMALNDYPGNRQADLQFHGVNDNMPAKAAMGMILGGEYFADAQAVEHGLWSLRQLRDLLTRRGMVSEFNSPTYSPLTLGNLTEISHYAKNHEARHIASQCVERVWADILARFHPPTGINAGPYTRAYTTDSVGHLSSLNFMLWLTFGDGIFPRPLDEVTQEPPRLVFHHEGDLYFVIAQKCWLASFEFAPPSYLLDWLNARTYPFTVIATAERSEGGNDAWEASEILATTYQQEDFALSTSEGDWGYQAEECFMQYRLHNPIRGVHDVRTGYSRLLINGDLPGQIHSNHNGLFTGEKDWLADHGRYHTIQHDNVALVVVGPNLKLTDKPISRLGAAYIFPEHLTSIEKIEIADGHVWMQDGPIFFSLRPLGAVQHGDPSPMTLEKVNRYRMIWMPNYTGATRTFSRSEIANTVNGFVIVIGNRRDETFEAFRNRVLTASVLDYHFAGARTVRYQLGDLQMGLSYGTVSNQARFMTINGKPVPHPLWQADGLPPQRLPFLDGKPQLNDLSLPFKQLAIKAIPNEPWQIFSTGRK